MVFSFFLLISSGMRASDCVGGACYTANLPCSALMYIRVGFIWNEFEIEIWGKWSNFKGLREVLCTFFLPWWNLMDLFTKFQTWYKAYFILRACESLSLLCIIRCWLFSADPPSPRNANKQNSQATGSQALWHHFVFLFIVQTSLQHISNHINSQTVLQSISPIEITLSDASFG